MGQFDCSLTFSAFQGHRDQIKSLHFNRETGEAWPAGGDTGGNYLELLLSTGRNELTKVFMVKVLKFWSGTEALGEHIETVAVSGVLIG